MFTDDLGRLIARMRAPTRAEPSMLDRSQMSHTSPRSQGKARTFEWLFAIGLSLAVHAAFVLPWLSRRIELGDQTGSAIAVSLISTAPATPARAMESDPAVAPSEARNVSLPQTAIETPTEPESLTSELLEPAMGSVVDPGAIAEAAALAGVAASFASAVTSEPGQPGDSCKIADWLAAALRDSEDISRALHSVPRQTRSVANAVMLWNGEWVEPSPAAAHGVDAVRLAILAGIQTAPSACLVKPVTGPLLIPIADERETILLAIGSGVWRWADLIPASPGS